MKTCEKTEVGKLPEGILRWTCCAECPAGEYDSVKQMVWCGKFRSWYKGSDGCSKGPNK